MTTIATDTEYTPTNKQLGNKLSVYGIDKYEVLRWFILAVGSVGMGSWLFITGIAGTNIVIDSRILLTGGVVVFFMFFGVAVLCYLGILIWRQPRIAIYENGVTWTTRRQQHGWRWDEFTRFQGMIQADKSLGMVIIKSGEWKFYVGKHKVFSVLPWYERVAELCELLIMQIIAVLLPASLAALERGEVLEFGKLKLDNMGIQGGSQRVNWSGVRNVKFENGFLFITYKQGSVQKNARFDLPLPLTPNLQLLLQVIDSILRMQEQNKPETVKEGN